MHVSTPAPHSRPLRISDLPVMTHLIQADGINFQQTQDDLNTLLSLDKSIMFGMFSGEVHDDVGDENEGELLSMAGISTFHSVPSSLSDISSSSSCNSNDFGWLSYVATAPHARRKGNASTLISSLLNNLPQQYQEEHLPVGLYASALGAPLYEKYGFVSSGAVAQLVQYEYIGDADTESAGGKIKTPFLARQTENPTTLAADIDHDDGNSTITIVPASQVISEIISLDAQVYGVNREKILNHWIKPTKTETSITSNGMKNKSEKFPSSAAGANWALMDNNQAQGFILGRPIFHPKQPSSGVFLGPIIARNDDEASLLLQTCLSSLFENGITLVQCLTLLIDNHSSKKDGNYDDALRWCANIGGGRFDTQVKFTKVGNPSKLMVRGQSLPWLDRMRRQSGQDGKGKSKGLQDEESSLRSFAAAGYEYG